MVQPTSGFGISSFMALGQSAPQGDRNVGARASGNVGGRVFCVACAPAQVGSSRPAVTITTEPRTSSSDFCVPVLGCSLVQISYRPPSGSVGSRDALFGGSNGTFEGPLFGAWPLASQLGAFSSQSREGKDFGTVAALG